MIVTLMGVGGIVGIGIGALFAGLIIGFFVSRKVFQVQLKKNPPITEKQVRAMLAATGRKPSEAQVRAVMRSLGQ
ncbi:MAG: YneF family protein [Bacilli bacterium]